LTNDTITIERRYNGPPDSGHGGYVSGLLAQRIGGTAEVTLRAPPPLERELEVRVDGGRVALRDGETLLAEGEGIELELDVPAAVTFDEARRVEGKHVMFDKHIYPSCFGCGPSRAAGDGLRIFPGNVPEREMVAASWVPDASLADGEGVVREEFVWAALDCPSAFAAPVDGNRPALLGRYAVRVLRRVRAGERLVLTAWPLGEEGRKLYAASALFGEDGSLRAYARSTWVRMAG
jgi:hypothetical protein